MSSRRGTERSKVPRSHAGDVPMNRRLCLRWFAALTCSAALAAQVAAAAACVQAAPECGEWISLPGTTLRARVFRSLPLDVPNPAIKRALVIVHGGSRD